MALIDLYDLEEMDVLMNEYYNYDYTTEEPYPKTAGDGDFWFDEITRAVPLGKCSNCNYQTERYDITVGKRLCKSC